MSVARIATPMSDAELDQLVMLHRPCVRPPRAQRGASASRRRTS